MARLRRRGRLWLPAMGLEWLGLGLGVGDTDHLEQLLFDDAGWLQHERVCFLHNRLVFQYFSELKSADV